MKPSVKDFYTRVYEENLWQSAESASGNGSDSSHTQELINGLRPFLDKHQIASILDCPCGDWAWMQHVDLSGIKYFGADIVDLMIFENAKRFSRPGVSFSVMDILEDDLPKVDVVLARDVFIHFRHELIGRAITNIKRSGSKYLLTTHHTDINAEGPRGKYFLPDVADLGGDADRYGFEFKFRPLHFMAPPYNWPEPVDLLMEASHAWGGHKSLALWKLEDLPRY